MAVVSFSVEPSVLNGFMFYAAIVLAKTMAMSFVTAATRLKKKVFANPEDAAGMDGKVKFDDVDVERIRRCHQNDLENVYLFVLLALVYCFTGPSPSMALWHFRIFTASRITHTIVYLFQVPQPARGASFFVGVLVCASMIIQILAKTFI